MRDEPSNVIRVVFRKQKPKRRGLAIAFGSTNDGHVYISASGRQKMTIGDFNALIREMRDVRDDAKAKVKRG